jgi:hypothetical protein
MNRVQLLEAEEKKARHRIITTKKQASEIFFGKVVNEDRLRQKMNL